MLPFKILKVRTISLQTILLRISLKGLYQTLDILCSVSTSCKNNDLDFFKGWNDNIAGIKGQVVFSVGAFYIFLIAGFENKDIYI